MSSRITAINVNVDSKIKEEATIILKDLGLNMSTAINMFLTQIVKREGIPFEIKNPKPNKKMKKALKEVQDIIDGKIESKGYRNIEELFKDLDSDD